MLSNIEQVRARGGRVIALINPEDTQVREKADHVIEVPSTTPLLSAVLNVIPCSCLPMPWPSAGSRRGSAA
jgi:glucosamine--fructose-6-phosphate aminotransferase (isomerizing)